MSRSEAFSRYAELARELDHVRAGEDSRSAETRDLVETVTAQADQLEARLNGQRGMLVNLAKSLRIRAPKFTPSLPEGDPDLMLSLTTIESAIERGDRAAEAAVGRDQQGEPIGLSAAAMSFAAYGLAALAILAFQASQLTGVVHEGSSPAGPNFIVVMILVPAIGFGVASLYLRYRTGSSRSLPARQRPRTRMGFLLCFAIGPIALVVFFLANWQQSLPK